MVLPSFLTIAWWVARGTGVGAAATRFCNGSSLKAVATAVIVVALISSTVLAWFGARADVAEGRDAVWKSKLAIEALLAARRQAARDRAAEAAAAAERQRMTVERKAMSERVADLERKLATLEQQSGDPVIFPRDLVRSLRE